MSVAINELHCNERDPSLCRLERVNALFDGNNQFLEASQRVVDVAHLVLDVETLNACSQRAKYRAHFEPRQVQADTGMRARTKCDLFNRIASVQNQSVGPCRSFIKKLSLPFGRTTATPRKSWQYG